MTDAVWVGVLRIVFRLPGARSLKDGRQALHSLRDRVRHRFEVTFHEIDAGEHIGRRIVAITTAGNDRHLVRTTLDRVRALVESNPDALVASVDVDVFRWHPPEQAWGTVEPHAGEEE